VAHSCSIIFITALMMKHEMACEDKKKINYESNIFILSFLTKLYAVYRYILS